jgi:hypothetical protein
MCFQDRQPGYGANSFSERLSSLECIAEEFFNLALFWHARGVNVVCSWTNFVWLPAPYAYLRLHVRLRDSW